MQESKRTVKVSVIQLGGAVEDKEKNLKKVLNKIDEAGKGKPDFILLPELSTTPYFCTVRDPKYFEWAEPVPGPTTDIIAKKAKKYGCCILMPLFEKGPVGEVYYNSVAVIGSDGKIIEGDMARGGKRRTFSKVHLGEVAIPGLDAYEKFYFKPGEGVPIFKTPKAKIGILVCYDRRIPEIWRTLALKGAEIVFVASSGAMYLVNSKAAARKKSVTSSADIFTCEMRTRAQENMLFAAVCNKAGPETVAGKKSFFYGMSCIVNPSGVVLAQAGDEPAIISATMDLGEIEVVRGKLHLFRDRRPELYLLEPEDF